MISPHTIEAIRQLNIEDVVGKYLKLSKHTACCPFHNEKSPSFRINAKKNTFKCFGCGVGGDGIRFVEMHDKLSFTETLERLARDHNIAVEYIDDFTPEQRKEYTDKIDTYRKVLNYAQDFYRNALSKNVEVKNYLLGRGIDDDDIEEWQLGFAPDGFQGIVKGIIGRGWYEAAFHLGLIGTTNGTSWDMYRNRITIPLTDRHGQLIGFSARVMDDSKPKYLNPVESDVYQKANVWFGFDKAVKAIHSEKKVYIVEGYFDVISMQKKGVLNTIASCGTAIDEKQFKYLKSHTNTIAIMYDGDNAGQDKIRLHTLSALQFGFAVEVVSLVDGIDPDDLAKQFDA